MTREEAKEMLPIIKAFCEGKQIQFLFDEWKDIDEIGIREFLENPELYRIKPEPKYRPFKDTEECWQEMQKHQPFGWLKTDEGYEQIWHITEGDDFNATIKYCTFVDGQPFGIKGEE